MSRVSSAAAIAVVAVMVASSGCATSLWYLPRKTEVDTVTGARRVELRSVPDGAEVSRDGKVLGRAPTSAKLAHDYKRTRRTKRWLAPVVVAFVEIVVFGIAVRTDLDERVIEDDDQRRWAIAAAFVDYSLATILLLRAHTRNELVLETRTPLPREHVLTFAWDGFGSEQQTVVVPTQVLATGHRSSLGSFDEALIRWDRSAGIAPAPAGALNLGDAYSRLAERTRDPAHASRAVHFYELYLASDVPTPDLRRTVEAKLPALRAAAEEAP